MDDRRSEDRRKGDRPCRPPQWSGPPPGRSPSDGRRGDDRLLHRLQGADASAQIYTRTNTRGVLEATNIPEVPGDYRLAYPKRKGVVIYSPEFRLRPSSHAEFNDHIEAAANRYGLPIAFVRAVIQTESQFDPRAVSSVGAQGLMQLMPADRAALRRRGSVQPPAEHLRRRPLPALASRQVRGRPVAGGRRIQRGRKRRGALPRHPAVPRDPGLRPQDHGDLKGAGAPALDGDTTPLPA